jgi:translation initiation factor 2B subunit (eIF-2B alpha/beta/delta family)
MGGKVIVGAHAVMANGGVVAPVGLHMVALAARRHAVPFVVLAGVHKVHTGFHQFNEFQEQNLESNWKHRIISYLARKCAARWVHM